MKRVCFRQVAIALTLFVGFVCQETWGLAGDHGWPQRDRPYAESAAPIAGVQVIASAPSNCDGHD